MRLIGYSQDNYVTLSNVAVRYDTASRTARSLLS